MSADQNDRPLVEFTSLAIAGAGIMTVSAACGDATLVMLRPLVAIGWMLLAFGVVRSLSHLGRRDRAPLAWRGIGRSPLTHEILLAASLLAAGALMAASDETTVMAAFIRPATAILGVLFLLSIGRVYALGGQPAWQGVSAVAPLSTGLAFGAVMTASDGLPTVPPDVIYWLIGADALVFLARAWRVSRVLRAARTAGRPAPDPMPLLVARGLLLTVLPVAVLLFRPGLYAAIPAAFGIAIDRLGFYLLRAPQTTESEIARAESKLKE